MWLYIKSVMDHVSLIITPYHSGEAPVNQIRPFSATQAKIWKKQSGHARLHFHWCDTVNVTFTQAFSNALSVCTTGHDDIVITLSVNFNTALSMLPFNQLIYELIYISNYTGVFHTFYDDAIQTYRKNHLISLIVIKILCTSLCTEILMLRGLL